MIKLPTQVFVSHTEPEASKITPMVNERFWKPQGGMWTSTLDDEGGDWVRWLTGENYSLDDQRWGGKLWLLEPMEANLVIVGTPTDLKELHDSYPHPDSKKLEFEKIRSFMLLLDWEGIARDYDGLYVPDPWPWRFGGGSDFEMEASMFFYAMDAECTCWSRWCFEGEPRTMELQTLVKEEA